MPISAEQHQAVFVIEKPVALLACFGQAFTKYKTVANYPSGSGLAAVPRGHASKKFLLLAAGLAACKLRTLSCWGCSYLCL